MLRTPNLCDLKPKARAKCQPQIPILSFDLSILLNTFGPFPNPDGAVRFGALFLLFLLFFAFILMPLFHSFPVNVGEDCPVFDGLFEFCQLSAGGSVGKVTNPVYFIILYNSISVNFLLI